MPTFINETTCKVCGVPLFRRWSGDGVESWWVDGAGNLIGDDNGRSGPPGVSTVWGYVDWLRDNDPTFAIYSSWLCRADLGASCCPWQHPHQPAPVPVVYAPGESLPECCGWPAHLIRDGWRCRVTSLPLPHAQELAGGPAQT
jgi:hypothetical protein